jgi:hypothetical protein
MGYLQGHLDRLNTSSMSCSLLVGIESPGFLTVGVGLGLRVGWPI